jgi:peptidoglycan/LPS O-acetylase OafA/YrhL
MSAAAENPTPVGAPTALAEASGVKTKPSGKRGRMLEVDGYRALAAVLIVVAHAWMQGGYPFEHTWFGPVVAGFDLAVSLFFALSGFVTFLPLVRGALTGKVPNGRAFLVRRLYRVLPLYFVLIFVVWASRFTNSPAGWWDLLRHLTFTQVYDKTHIFWLNGPSWSLADEMHYYILISVLGPPLARIAARRSTVGRRLAVMAALPGALLVASLTYTSIVSWGMHIPFSDSWVYYNPLARADSFALGMLLAIAMSVPGAMAIRPRTATFLSAVGAAGIGVLWEVRWHVPFVQTYYFALAGLCSLLLLSGAAMLHERQLLGKFLRSRPLQTLAMIGFSLYLWHEPVMIQLVRWHVLYFIDPQVWPISTVALVAAVAIFAWLSYHLIEEPGVRMQKFVADLRDRRERGPQRRRGPTPRWLPDLTLTTADGVPVSLRELPRDRPVLFAFDSDRGARLEEQRFRLDAREADGFYVTSRSDGHAVPAGTTVLIDPDDQLTYALNGTSAALIEVSPAGLITALHEAPFPTTKEVMAR